MKVRMRWFNDNGTEYGNGRQGFAREAIAVLTTGHRVLRLSELSPGERQQLIGPECVAIETHDGRRAAIRLELEPERGEE